ncbi:hypothetical protein [Deinococcus sp. AJ005]|uniref:hypothetical protein n=1 Tax=Deinococcus sp. AJ005 TaxID=2652443 RepID=UPI0018656DAE|nr:hypothetical protein [Deinococcus sp. AJ005]
MGGLGSWKHYGQSTLWTHERRLLGLGATTGAKAVRLPTCLAVRLMVETVGVAQKL